MNRPDPNDPKVKQLMEGAMSAFAELGFSGSSTSEIAKRAGVSKATMYKLFATKEALFEFVVREACMEISGRMFDVDGDYDDDIRVELERVASTFIRFLTSDICQEVYRLAVSEGGRFPALARTYHQYGPELSFRRLSQLLAAGVARGDLRIDDVERAARQFCFLCNDGPFSDKLFQVRAFTTDEAIAEAARASVDMFVRAYGARADES